jgi:hypothetical protein
MFKSGGVPVESVTTIFSIIKFSVRLSGFTILEEEEVLQLTIINANKIVKK